MKHIILGFVILLIVPLFARRWTNSSYGRGFPIALLAVAVGQTFIGISKISSETLSQEEGIFLFVIALVLAILGSIWILLKPRKAHNI